MLDWGLSLCIWLRYCNIIFFLFHSFYHSLCSSNVHFVGSQSTSYLKILSSVQIWSDPLPAVDTALARVRYVLKDIFYILQRNERGRTRTIGEDEVRSSQFSKCFFVQATVSSEHTDLVVISMLLLSINKIFFWYMYLDNIKRIQGILSVSIRVLLEEWKMGFMAFFTVNHEYQWWFQELSRNYNIKITTAYWTLCRDSWASFTIIEKIIGKNTTFYGLITGLSHCMCSSRRKLTKNSVSYPGLLSK